MKKIVLILMICLLGITSWAQECCHQNANTPQRTLIVKATNDQKFIVSLNGKKQNTQAQSLVEIKNLDDKEYVVKVDVVTPKVKKSKAQMNIRMNGQLLELEVNTDNNQTTLLHSTTCGTKHSNCNHNRGCSGCPHHK